VNSAVNKSVKKDVTERGGAWEDSAFRAIALRRLVRADPGVRATSIVFHA
jgi:hypothetical protein